MLKYMPVYTIALIVALLSGDFFELNMLPKIVKHYSYYDYFFTLIELLVFSHFFYLTLKTPRVKKTILITVGSFIPLFFYFLINDKSVFIEISESTQSTVYTIEALILVIPAFYYFIELFKHPPKAILTNEPSFWVSTGILFFLICTLPFSLIENKLTKIDLALAVRLYAIFFIFYIILFIMIIRAYLCKPTEQNY
jgi:hypothetical protein